MPFTPLNGGTQRSYTRSFLRSGAPKPPTAPTTNPAAKSGPTRSAAGGPPKPTKPTFAGGVSKADDGVIHQVNMARKKTPTQRRIAHQKKAQAVISLTGGTLGLAALGTRGRSAQLTRRAIKIPDQAEGLVQRAGKLKDRSTAMTTAGAGVGGLGAFNFASYTNAEANKVRKSQMDEAEVEKALKMPKGVTTAVGNFRAGYANPAGRAGQAQFSTKSGRVGQFVGRRAVAQQQPGVVSRTVDRIEESATKRGKLTPVKQLPKSKQNGVGPDTVTPTAAAAKTKPVSETAKSNFGRGVALGAGAGAVGTFGGLKGYDAYKSRKYQ